MELPNDIATCHRIILELASAFEGIKPQLEDYIHQIEGYIQQIEVQRGQIDAQRDQIEVQRGQIDKLELRVKEWNFSEIRIAGIRATIGLPSFGRRRSVYKIPLEPRYGRPF